MSSVSDSSPFPGKSLVQNCHNRVHGHVDVIGAGQSQHMIGAGLSQHMIGAGLSQQSAWVHTHDWCRTVTTECMGTYT